MNDCKWMESGEMRGDLGERWGGVGMGMAGGPAVGLEKVGNVASVGLVSPWSCLDVACALNGASAIWILL